MTRVLSIPDMSCGHCKVTVEQALLAIEGVKRASVDLDARTVSVEYSDSVSEDALRVAVSEAGYSVSDVAV